MKNVAMARLCRRGRAMRPSRNAASPVKLSTKWNILSIVQKPPPRLPRVSGAEAVSIAWPQADSSGSPFAERTRAAIASSLKPIAESR
jgi:hypothetical protein